MEHQLARWSDDEGVVRGRCFFGEHRVHVTLASGMFSQGAFTLKRDGERTIQLTL